MIRPKSFFLIGALLGFQCGDARISKEIFFEDLLIKNGKVTYKNELLNGHFIIYKSDRPGIAWRKGSYLQGLLDGQWVEYYEDGTISRVQEYKMGIPHLHSRYWYANGKKRAYYSLVNGHQHGDQWEWAPGGWLADYKKYEHGKLLIHKIWRNNKQIYANYTIRDKSFVGKGGEKLCRKVTAGDGTNNVLVE